MILGEDIWRALVRSVQRILRCIYNELMHGLSWRAPPGATLTKDTSAGKGGHMTAALLSPPQKAFQGNEQTLCEEPSTPRDQVPPCDDVAIS